MGQKEKLIKKLKTSPKTFTFDDTCALMQYFSFNISNKGKTSGSRIIFVSEKYGKIIMHKPHPQKELKDYQVKQLTEKLEQEGLL